MKPSMEKETIKTISTHYIDGTFVESHGREIMGIDEYTNRDLRLGGTQEVVVRNRESRSREAAGRRN